jgi:hypothetical protein
MNWYYNCGRYRNSNCRTGKGWWIVHAGKSALVVAVIGSFILMAAQRTFAVTSVTMDITATPGPTDDNYTYDPSGNYYYTEDFTPGNGTADYLAVALNFDGNDLVDEFDNISATGPYTITLFDTDPAQMLADPACMDLIFKLSTTEIPLDGLTIVDGNVTFSVPYSPLPALDGDINPQQSVTATTPLPSTLLMSLVGVAMMAAGFRLRPRAAR